MRVPQRETAFLRVGAEGQTPKDDGYREDAVPQTCLEAIQEWFQVRKKPLWDLIWCERTLNAVIFSL